MTFTRRVRIINGPSKLNLMLALFEHKELNIRKEKISRTIDFKVEVNDGKNKEEDYAEAEDCEVDFVERIGNEEWRIGGNFKFFWESSVGDKDADGKSLSTTEIDLLMESETSMRYEAIFNTKKRTGELRY